jgi:uncharacterized protein
LSLDARPGRLRIDVAELRQRPGTTRKVDLTTAIPDISVGEVRVPDDAPIVLDLMLEGIQGGIDVTGSVSTNWIGPCRRCLDEVEGDLQVSVHEVFAEDHVDGETYPLRRDSIDLREMTRDIVLLGLPLVPLCSPDCAGPSPDVFPLVGGNSPEAVDGDVVERPPDPRWAALDELRAQFGDNSDPPDQVG